MRHYRAGQRRHLEDRLARFVGPPPDAPYGGWIRAMRDALGMSSYQLARRMRFSPSRVRQFEREEVDGTIRLSTLRRAAEALNCTAFYVLLPNEGLEDTVLRQACLKAATQLCVLGPDHPSAGDPDLVPEERIEELEDLTLHYVDHRDLWD